MPLDGSILGNVASGQMEALERDYGDAEDVQIGTAITIVEIQRIQPGQRQGNVQVASDVRIRFNAGDPFRVVGLLEQTIHNLMAGPGFGGTAE
jgi:hypothetical protein